MIMQVEVRIVSGLIRATSGPLEVDDGADGMDVLSAMGVQSTESIIMIVNGRRRDLNTKVGEGDKIHFLTPLAGG
jgi:molybdopterin converting factor small subunit